MGLQSLADLLGQRVDENTSPNVLTVPSGKVLLVTPKGHKMQTDRHYKEAVSAEVRLNNLAMTSAAYCRSHGSAAESTAVKWDERYCSEAVAAAMLTVRNPGTVWLPSDALRVGRPAEETLVIAFWDQRSDVGLGLLPQVPWNSNRSNYWKTKR